jgi:uncharacterized protein (DUF1501 family)
MTASRRAFLKTSGLALVSLGVGSAAAPGFLHRAALAAAAPTSANGRRKVLVAIFQRGAMDALAAVPPLEHEALLRSLRPRLFQSAARAAGADAVLDLGVGFGLHPAFAPLLPLWRDGALGVVQAVGSPDATRSHFDAQDYMETGTPGRKGTSSGWLNRVVGELGHEGTPFRAVSITPALPRSLYGEEPAVAVARLEDFHLAAGGSGPAATSAGAGRGFEALYSETANELLRSTGGDTFEAMKVLDSVAGDGRGAVAAGYPASPLGSSLAQIARLVRAQVGLEVAFAESGGWDTHVRQGAATGTFAQRGRDLAQSIAAFWSDLGEHRSDVVVLTMTEFGRTVRENGSAGTDHGHASCSFVLGEKVLGGKVHGPFPGLREHELYEGRDLAVGTDFRALFSGVSAGHLGVRNPGELFPGWDGKPVQLLRA